MLNSFFRNLYKFGIARIFLSADFVLSVIVLLILERLTLGQSGLNLDLGPLLDVLVGLFAFVFAALAIMIALSSSAFYRLLRKTGSHDGILFHYWYACVVYLVSILYVLPCILFSVDNRFAVLGAIFLCTYSILLTFGVVKVTISLGLYKNLNDQKIDQERDYDAGE